MLERVDDQQVDDKGTDRASRARDGVHRKESQGTRATVTSDEDEAQDCGPR